MPITTKTKQIVWARAAGRCSFPGCPFELIMDGTGSDNQSLVGDICHIVAQSTDGPRGAHPMPLDERDRYPNLLLLCKVHHKLVDDQPSTYTIDVLRGMKEQHERWVRETLLRAPGAGALVPPPFGTETQAAPELFGDDGDPEQMAVKLQRQVSEHPEDTTAWEALAWAQYRCFRYAEAMRSINTALASGRASEDAEGIRACILTEDAIRRGDRAGLLEARGVFKRRSETRGYWVDHYNHGNVLTALHRHEEAVTAYLQALEVDPSQVQVWKNLASTYHLLGRHDEEMEAFDRALALDPDRPEALASKGVSLLVDQGDAAGAVRLLDRALEVAPGLWPHWPHIWYWLAQAHRAAGAPDQALKVVREGVRAAPSDSYLRDLKALLLAERWREEPDLIPEALEFYQLLVELSPYNYADRCELVTLHLATGGEEAAWDLLEAAFDLLELQGGSELRRLGVSAQECARALRFLPDYAALRQDHPVSLYWNEEDPLWVESGLASSPHRSAAAELVLSAAGAVAFGLMADPLHENPEHRNAAALVGGWQAAAAALLTASMSFTVEILETEFGHGEESNRISVFDVPEFVSFTFLREISRTNGWAMALIKVPEGERERAMDTYPVAEFSNLISYASSTILFEVAHLEDSEKG